MLLLVMLNAITEAAADGWHRLIRIGAWGEGQLPALAEAEELREG